MPKYTVGNKLNDGSRDKIWTTIRSLKEFTCKDVMFKCGIERKTVEDYVKRLERGGFVQTVSEKVVNNNLSQRKIILIKDRGVEPPRLRKDGTEMPTPTTQKIWQAIKALRDFSIDEILMTVDGTTRETVSSYVKLLTRAEYLKRKGLSNSNARYCVVSMRKMGAKAPKVLKIKQVYDPNIDQIVWPLEGQSQ
ncbi:MAG: hypothetical protein CFH43_00905 [Proteobacteria bacterium]|nr:MAG: hypothetical protein CFH43_00905 [Pseudomonadota bacterium]